MYEPTAAEKERRVNTVRWRGGRAAARPPRRPTTYGMGRAQRRREEAVALRSRLKATPGKRRRRLLQALREQRDRGRARLPYVHNLRHDAD